MTQNGRKPPIFPAVPTIPRIFPPLQPLSSTYIRPRQLDDARRVLEAAGFVRTHSALFQETWDHDTGMGFIHTIDLHWEVFNTPGLTRDLLVEECLERSVPLPRFAPGARAEDLVSLLLHGFVNQAWHRHHGTFVDDRLVLGGARLIWAWDTHLGARELSEAQWDELLALSLQRGTGPLTRDALALAAQAFGTPVPERVSQALQALPDETPASRLVRKRDVIEDFRVSFFEIPGWAARLRYLSLHVLPDGATLRQKYPAAAGWPLPLLHLRRMLGLVRLVAGRIRR